MTRKRKKHTSPGKIEIGHKDLLRLVTDYSYDGIEIISEKVGRLRQQKLDLLSDIDEPRSVNDWMQSAVNMCLKIINESYEDIGKHIKSKIKDDENEYR